MTGASDALRRRVASEFTHDAVELADFWRVGQTQQITLSFDVRRISLWDIWGIWQGRCRTAGRADKTPRGRGHVTPKRPADVQ